VPRAPGVQVHMDCYGVRNRPDGCLWLCDVCALGPPPLLPVPRAVAPAMSLRLPFPPQSRANTAMARLTEGTSSALQA